MDHVRSLTATARSTGHGGGGKRALAAIDTSVPVVLLGDGFRHGTLGIVRSLGRLGVSVYAVDGDPREPALASRYCRGASTWDVARRLAADTVAFLDDLGRRLGRQPVLIPTNDATALFVATHGSALAQRFRFPQRPPELVRAFSDKREAFYLAQRLGIPTPTAVFPQSRDDVLAWLARAVFPVALKRIDRTRLDARTGTSMVIVRSERELLEQYEKLEDPACPNLMLQEYIPGGDDTVWMFNGYFNSASECVAGFTGRKLRQHPVHRGSTSLGISDRNDTVERVTVRFMKAVGYRGILDVDYCYDARDGLYKLLDPNPRIGSTFRLFVSEDGMDVVRYQYLDLTGQPLPPAVPREGRRWIVEDRDIDSCLAYRREGQLTVPRWLGSLRGIDEAAWFARDDLAPFWRVCFGWTGRALRRAVRRAWPRSA